MTIFKIKVVLWLLMAGDLELTAMFLSLKTPSKKLHSGNRYSSRPKCGAHPVNPPVVVDDIKFIPKNWH